MPKGIDSPKRIVSILGQLQSEHYTFAARYYFRQSAYKDLLNYPEAKAISAAGLSIISIFENGFPTNNAYFSVSQAEEDADTAVDCALAAKQPSGTVIYFAYDGDIDPAVTRGYGAKVRDILTDHGYLAGGYGSGAVLEYLGQLGYIAKEWLTQSHGWAGYEAELAKDPSIVQGQEGTFCGRDVDYDYTTGSGGGWQVAD